jgi:hypothetical protein
MNSCLAVILDPNDIRLVIPYLTNEKGASLKRDSSFNGFFWPPNHPQCDDYK